MSMLFKIKLTTSLENDSHYAQYATPEVIKRDRSLIEIWDLLSLALCQGLRSEQQFNQVPRASGETTLTLTPVNDNATRVKVAPWPFAQSEVTLVFEGRILREKFTDETVMRTALADAECIAITTNLCSK